MAVKGFTGMSVQSLQACELHKLNISETLKMFMSTSQGGHEYMRTIASGNGRDRQVYMGVFYDGHSGEEASEYAAVHLYTVCWV